MSGVPPIVLCVSGLDPSGGAGAVADVTTVARLGCHPQLVVTANTVQNFAHCAASHAADTALLQAQLDCLCAEGKPNALKIGMLANDALAEVTNSYLQTLGDIPAVLDPVMRASHGVDLFATAQSGLAVFLSLLQRPATVCTPNIPELLELANQAGIGVDTSVDDVAKRLSARIAASLFVTGTHSDEEKVRNALYQRGACVLEIQSHRLPGEYHGSGCTLASALAAFLARGFPLPDACRAAQHFTLRALETAYATGSGGYCPNRLGSHEE